MTKHFRKWVAKVPESVMLSLELTGLLQIYLSSLACKMILIGIEECWVAGDQA